MEDQAATTIQRAWRVWRGRQQWSALLAGGRVTLDTVIKHVHPLDIRDLDFREELELQERRAYYCCQ